MREIIFRGKRIDNGEWVEGDLVRHYENQRRFIALDQMAFTYSSCGIGRLVSERYCEVDQNTGGQYTGLKDKTGKAIYEGDIFTKYFNHLAKRLNGVVMFKDGAYIVAFSRNTEYLLMDVLWDKTAEVIGNIYENPELLEVQK